MLEYRRNMCQKYRFYGARFLYALDLNNYPLNSSKNLRFQCLIISQFKQRILAQLSVLYIKVLLKSPFIIIQMSSHRAMTLSMQSLNKLYFQFFDRFVLSNLSKQVGQITQLMKQKTAYEVHRYLEETLAGSEDNFSNHTNPSLNSPTSSLNNLSTGIPSNNYPYQYALASQQESKTNHTDNLHNFEKTTDKQIEENVSFKNKLGMRRVHTGLPFQEHSRPYDPYEYKHTIDDNLVTVPNLTTNNLASDGLLNIPSLTTTLTSDFKVDYAANKEASQDKKSKIMRQQVRKISKVFNESHSKIEKYSKNGSPQNKLFNLNISTKIQKREEGTWLKQYPAYQPKQQLHSWRM